MKYCSSNKLVIVKKKKKLLTFSCYVDGGNFLLFVDGIKHIKLKNWDRNCVVYSLVCKMLNLENGKP